MNDSLAYIENYFSGELPPSEKAAFEERCVSDPLFAQDVAFYVSARDAIRKELNEQKKNEFAALYTELSSKTPGAMPGEGLELNEFGPDPDKELNEQEKPSSPEVYSKTFAQQYQRTGIIRKIIPYASLAAACLILYVGWQLFFSASSPQKMADQYIENDLSALSKTMEGKADSMQIGISAYNLKQYARAEEIFSRLASGNAENAEAISYLGITYLVTGRYDEALVQFDALSRTSLEANRGPFLTALVLMKRSAKGDRERARKLLEEVRDNGLPGSREAKKWLEDM